MPNGVVVIHYGGRSIIVSFNGREYEIYTNGIVCECEGDMRPDIPPEIFEFKDKWLGGEV